MSVTSKVGADACEAGLWAGLGLCIVQLCVSSHLPFCCAVGWPGSVYCMRFFEQCAVSCQSLHKCTVGTRTYRAGRVMFSDIPLLMSRQAERGSSRGSCWNVASAELVRHLRVCACPHRTASGALCEHKVGGSRAPGYPFAQCNARLKPSTQQCFCLPTWQGWASGPMAWSLLSTRQCDSHTQRVTFQT